ncbi:CBS domain-containing protein [Guggenheimella bovis]
MNAAFYLTPKKDVIFEHADATVRQLFEKMNHHRYAALPILDEKGHYVRAITEGDLLRKVNSLPDGKFRDLEFITVRDIPSRKDYKPLSINTDLSELLEVAVHQNFVPITDDQGIFIGIVKRSDLFKALKEALV